jgi:RNA polymerase sigma-70 factor (ECF subfamily)
VLTAAQVGAGWALTRIFDAYGSPVDGYLRSQGAEDHELMTNEVFLRTFRRIGSFSGSEDQFRSWVFTIAHNLLIDERRRMSRRPEEVPLDEVAQARVRAERPAEAIAFEELGSERVQAILSTLAPQQRDVLLLRILADMSCEEVAKTLGKSVGAVKQLQRRGLESLRRELMEPIPQSQPSQTQLVAEETAA